MRARRRFAGLIVNLVMRGQAVRLVTEKTCATSSINVARFRLPPWAGFKMTRRQPFGSGREHAPA